MFNTKKMSFTEFKNTYRVWTRTRNVSLKQYAAERGITNEQLRSVYECLVNTMPEYLGRVYKVSLSMPDDPIASIRQITDSNKQKTASKNIVRNLYMRDLWADTTCGIDGSQQFLDVVLKMVNDRSIESKIVTPSGIGLIQRKKFSGIMTGFYFRSSIMNPALVYSWSLKHLKGARVFSPTLGWSSYMLGFLANPAVEEYVGTDVINKVCTRTKQLAKHYFPTQKVDIRCTPSEDLLKDKAFMHKYQNYFDVIFFSPPYFRLELYKGANQSTARYPEYEQWLEEYWDATMRLCAHVLKPSGRMGFVVSEYGDKETLVADMSKIAARHFRRTASYPMSGRNVSITHHREASEKLYLHKKK